MLIFVDYEHAEGYAGEHRQRLQAARTWITYRLEDLSGLPCMLVRYDRITDDLLARLEPKALFISGNAADAAFYGAETATLARIITSSGLPVFGFCGGWQAMAQAFGSTLRPIDIQPEHESLPIVADAPGGWKAEFGYHPVRIDAEHELLEGVGTEPVFRHAHGLHIPDPPQGFDVVASTEVTPVQMAVDDERRMVGTQFHPEYWTKEHPAGRTLIANFLRWIDT